MDFENSFEEQRAQDSEFELDLLIQTIFHRYQYDFSGYSRASLKRRLIRACEIRGCASFSQLQHTILHDTPPFDSLLDIITVRVSDLFRDPHYFKAFRELVVPQLRTYPSINLWVAGCATGEEAISLAIILREEGLESRSTVYATDINANVLKQAKRGVYTFEQIKNFSENYLAAGGTHSLSDYYTTGYNAAKMNRDLLDRIVFSEHNLVSDGSFAEMQFISCRNVLIYFGVELQARAIALFEESLCRRGFLGLGSKESLQRVPQNQRFVCLDQTQKLYQKGGVVDHGRV
ncbi:CheR family methyltransferase [Halioxenophilus aromaticivorans]|uniref:Chemotaxis protein CheR n=1 Tax=Halioxenophilus aromaticivorans TaxID=1306992 RepID=A0AAV3U435_9ALTE